MTDEASRPNLTAAIFGGCGMAWAGIASLFWLSLSTPEFRGISAPWIALMAGVIAVVLLTFAIVASSVASFLQRRGYWPRLLSGKAILISGAVLLALGIGTGVYDGIPQVRLKRVVPAAEGIVSDVQVAGFDSFLARRWLLSFHVTSADAERIASSLGLQEDKEVDLRRSLGKDPFFSNRGLGGDMVVPEGTRGYFRRFIDGPEDQSVEWITMAVSEEQQRAWLYVGYQN
ncbi:hypothetical protein [Luteolibacter soli]|uniref:DUF1109 domain-containing protein n=1 Tax=Luteolibacter soli TaxID=3135280 RepID=A0ABU9AUF3_9BACT